jgi:hypothetical protein
MDNVNEFSIMSDNVADKMPLPLSSYMWLSVVRCIRVGIGGGGVQIDYNGSLPALQCGLCVCM